MSYAIFTHYVRGRRMFYLQGQGEHTGTTLALSDRDVLNMPPAAHDLAAELDRRFQLKHAERLAGGAKIQGLEITGGPWFDEAPK